jgi:hypothetical protein
MGEWEEGRVRVSDPYPDPHGSALIPDPHSNCGSGSGRAKLTHKNRKKSRIFMKAAPVAWASFMEA